LYLTPDLESAEAGEKLDITLPIYLVYQNINAGLGGTGIEPVPNGPKRIDDVISSDVLDEFKAEIFYDLAFDVEYHACPDGEGLDAPQPDSYPINQDGTLHVQDLNFGGIGSGTVIQLTRDYEITGGFGRTVVVVGWARPGTQFDYCGGAFNKLPGDVGCISWPVSGILAGNLVPVYVPRKVVLWVSTDAAGTTPRAVDASDLAALAAHLDDNGIDWGFTFPSGNESTRNYHLNFNLDGDINVSDLAVIAEDLALDNCYDTGKPQSDERDTIFAWFGIEPTGNTVADYRGRQLPGYEVVDWSKLRSAVQDPYGYRRLIKPLQPTVEWSTVKELYR